MKDYQKKAIYAYRDRLRNKGWTLCAWHVPNEIKKLLFEYKNELLEKYKLGLPLN